MGSNRRRVMEFFYKNFVESSFEEESDGETKILLAAAQMVHNHYLLPPHRGGSSKQREANQERDREDGHIRLYKDYFYPTDAVFKEKAFCCCYRMSRDLFLQVLNGVTEYNNYFEAKYDCTDKIGFSSYQKCSAAIRQLAYGFSCDLLRDYMRMSEFTCHEAMYRFCSAVIAVFDKVYLRETDTKDTARLLSINERSGFSGMLGSITACIGSGRTVPLVGKGSSKGMQRAGSNNDINVLQRSLVFARLPEGNAPQPARPGGTPHAHNSQLPNYIAAAPTELADSFPQPNRDLSRSLPSVSHPRPPHAGRSPQRAKKGDGIGALIPALRRQPLGRGHLGRDGRALRGHLLAPHLPHHDLQLPPRLHRAPLPQARLHEVHLLRLRRLRGRRLLLPARLLAGQEDGPRRVQPQGRIAGALLRQAQVRRRRGRRPLRRLRPAQLALRGTRRRQVALRARAARATHEPPRPARERPHRLRHGLPLLPLLHEHPDEPPEAARLHAAPCGRWGRPRALRHARPQSQLSLVYRYL